MTPAKIEELIKSLRLRKGRTAKLLRDFARQEAISLSDIPFVSRRSLISKLNAILKAEKLRIVRHSVYTLVDDNTDANN